VTDFQSRAGLAGATLTARRAARTIVLGTFAVTLACGILMRLLDHNDFPTLGKALWWAIQTVTTVGYGDAVPASATGQVIASILMVVGIAFVTVLTASVTAAFVESARRRSGDDPRVLFAQRLDDLDARLDRIESLLTQR
jgi:voltage-gated potassium channel